MKGVRRGLGAHPGAHTYVHFQEGISLRRTSRVPSDQLLFKTEHTPELDS